MYPVSAIANAEVAKRVLDEFTEVNGGYWVNLI